MKKRHPQKSFFFAIFLIFQVFQSRFFCIFSYSGTPLVVIFGHCLAGEIFSRFHRFFGKKKIKTQIDLRKSEEILDQGKGPLESMGANYVNIPIIPEGGSERLSKLVGDTGISGKRYLGYLEFGPQSWLEIFDILSKPNNLPVVLHCTAGKDRTGVSTAFLLSILNVSRDLIEEDYKLTNLDTQRQADFIENTVGLPEGFSRDDMIMAAGVPEDAMKVFLDGVESGWGSVLGYLEEIGITKDQMEAIRINFLE